MKRLKYSRLNDKAQILLCHWMVVTPACPLDSATFFDTCDLSQKEFITCLPRLPSVGDGPHLRIKYSLYSEDRIPTAVFGGIQDTQLWITGWEIIEKGSSKTINHKRQEVTRAPQISSCPIIHTDLHKAQIWQDTDVQLCDVVNAFSIFLARFRHVYIF